MHLSATYNQIDTMKVDSPFIFNFTNSLKTNEKWKLETKNWKF